MRDIKFRAWDKEFKSFSPRALNYPVKDLEWLTDYEWQQYIGLKDKNGKEIYEGDVFRTSIGAVAVVEWEKEGRFLGFTVSGERKIVYINREPMVEVIGNIYENPGLLKEGVNL